MNIEVHRPAGLVVDKHGSAGLELVDSVDPASYYQPTEGDLDGALKRGHPEGRPFALDREPLADDPGQPRALDFDVASRERRVDVNAGKRLRHR